MDGTVGNEVEMWVQAVSAGEGNRIVLRSDAYVVRMGSDRFRKRKEACRKRLID